MRSSRGTLALLVVAPLCLAACQTNEQTGGLVGAGTGALLGGVLGNAIGHNAAGTLIGAGIGAAGGYFIGSAIGRQLDERDRERAMAATQQVLAEPVYFPPSGAPPPPPRSASWTSDHNTGARGSTSVVAVRRQAAGGECRTLREVAYIKGEEVVQNSRYCRSSDGAWTAQT